MSIFDYGTLLCPKPIKLSIGTLRKPKLNEIYDITFERFYFFEVLLKLTPETYYTSLMGDDGEQKWNSFGDDEKKDMTLYSLILNDERLQQLYTEMFGFFFIEDIVFRSPYFVILNNGISDDHELTKEDVHGVISENTFSTVLLMIQQICCIYEKEAEEEVEPKFKNALAKKMYEKMKKAKKEQERTKRGNKDLAIPNIISKVSNKHLSINPINVWDMTLFQLIDSFNCLRVNSIYDINSTRVAVWGDEKKTFDMSQWYKANEDNNDI